MTHRPLSAAELLAMHTDRIEAITQFANEASPQAFEAQWLTVLEDCAQWFSSLPLCINAHAEPGGAFRATVETAYYALRFASGFKFAADLPSERRRRLEPQYLHALFLAACCAWLDEPWRHFIVHRDGEDAAWLPLVHGPLGPWVGTSHYTVTRRPQSHAVERMRRGLLARDVLSAPRLARFDDVVLGDLLASLDPTPTPAGQATLLHKLLRQAADAVSQTETQATQAIFVAAAPPNETGDAVNAPSPAEVITSGTDLVPPESPKPLPGADAPLPTGSWPSPQIAVDPAPALASVIPTSANADHAEADTRHAITSVEQPALPSLVDRVDALLSDTPGFAREFVVALVEDIDSGKAKCTRTGDRIALSKRALSQYGLSTEALTKVLADSGLLQEVTGHEVVLDSRLASFVKPVRLPVAMEACAP